MVTELTGSRGVETWSVTPKALGADRANRRSSRRLRVWQQAKIVFGNKMIHCMVRDISRGGAGIVIRKSVLLPETFDLYIAAHELRLCPARLRWRNEDFAGVSFGSDQANDAPAVASPSNFS